MPTPLPKGLISLFTSCPGPCSCSFLPWVQPPQLHREADTHWNNLNTIHPTSQNENKRPVFSCLDFDQLKPIFIHHPFLCTQDFWVTLAAWEPITDPATPGTMLWDQHSHTGRDKVRRHRWRRQVRICVTPDAVS